MASTQFGKFIIANSQFSFLNRKYFLLLCKYNPIRKYQLTQCQESFPTDVKNDRILSSDRDPLRRCYYTSEINLRYSKGRESSVPHSNPSNEDTLEQLFNNLTYNKEKRKRVYKEDLLNIIGRVAENKYASQNQALLLISCCSDFLADEVPSERISLLDKSWSTLIKCTKINVNHYNELLQCYIENNHYIDPGQFIQDMGKIKPNETTYQLLLANVCKVGDMDKAVEILNNMNVAKMPKTDHIFNCLIEGHGRAGDLENAIKTFEVMKQLDYAVTSATHVAFIKANIWNQDNSDLKSIFSLADDSGVVFKEKQIIEIVKCLISNKREKELPNALCHFPKSTLMTPSPSSYLISACTQLIHEGYPKIAFQIIEALPLPPAESTVDVAAYGRVVLRETVKAVTPLDVIKEITLDFKNSGRNSLALQVVCEAAMQLKKDDVARSMLSLMKEHGFSLRCHYFWPLLVNGSIKDGEPGIFNVLSFMNNLSVKSDCETIMDYVLPYVNINPPDNLMRKFQNVGITASVALTPMVVSLIKSNQISSACDLCNKFKGLLDCDVLTYPLIVNYASNDDIREINAVLQLFVERPLNPKKDWVGLFLISLVSNRKLKLDITKFNSLIESLMELNIRISQNAVQMCLRNTIFLNDGRIMGNIIRKNLISLISDESVATELYDQPVTYSIQKNMKRMNLEGHLVELESKEMNSRGVLRKLLQLYCRQGNIDDAKKIIKTCEDKKIVFTGGMKSSLMDLHLKCNDLESAEKYFKDLVMHSPGFIIDEHKVIDFATLLVRNGNISKAMEVLEMRASQQHIKGGKPLERNCWCLLDALSVYGKPKDTERMFEYLNKVRFCDATNIMLGPIIRSHLVGSNITGAVENFVRFAHRYKKTPLKHELLCTILRGDMKHSDENKETTSEDDAKQLMVAKETDKSKIMLRKVLESEKIVHGVISSKVSLISAMADVGFKKGLKSYLSENWTKVLSERFMMRCQRFSDERNLAALEVIAETFEGVQDFEINMVYELIMKIHCSDGNCEDALKLWEKLTENNKASNKCLVKMLSSMLTTHKMDIPDDVQFYLSK